MPGDIKKIARDVFHVGELRGEQEEVVRSIAGGRDTLAVFPTGWGKSIAFQLPALLLEGLTVVVSPLVSLMKDQVRALRALGPGIRADYLSSTRSREETNEIYQNLEKLKILYVTPERLGNRTFLGRLREKGAAVAQVAVDEAHCVSLWGRSFRPSYLGIRRFLEANPGAVVSAFSATAGALVTAEIIRALGMRDPAVFRQSFRRDNLRMAVTYVRDKTGYLLENLDGHSPAVVYVSSRSLCDRLRHLLDANGFKAAAYHAGMDGAERGRSQDAFMNGACNVMVATSAFGMGLDKKDIRRVFHYDPPFELEEYIQEIGRAGRDGGVSRVELLAGLEDEAEWGRSFSENYPSWRVIRASLRRKGDGGAGGVLEGFMEKMNIKSEAEILPAKNEYLRRRREAAGRHRAVSRYASGSGCRNVFFHEYLGETSGEFAGGCGCDSCVSMHNGFGINKWSAREASLTAYLLQKRGWEPLDRLVAALQGGDDSLMSGRGYASLRGVSRAAILDAVLLLKNRGVLEFAPGAGKTRVRKAFYSALNNGGSA